MDDVSGSASSARLLLLTSSLLTLSIHPSLFIAFTIANSALNLIRLKMLAVLLVWVGFPLLFGHFYP